MQTVNKIGIQFFIMMGFYRAGKPSLVSTFNTTLQQVQIEPTSS